MCGDDEVATELVIRVLQRNEVAVTQDGNTYTLSKGEVIEVQILNECCSRRMLQRFSRKFGIGIHLLFRPDFPKGVVRSVPRIVNDGD